MTKRQARLRKTFKATMSTAVSKLLYYDRKEDEELTPHDVEMLFANNVVSIEEALDWFRDAFVPCVKRMGGF